MADRVGRGQVASQKKLNYLKLEKTKVTNVGHASKMDGAKTPKCSAVTEWEIKTIELKPTRLVLREILPSLIRLGIVFS